MRHVFGVLPFSVGDIGYIVFLILIVKFVYRSFKNLKQQWKSICMEIISVLSIVYAMFHILWGLNYYRQPLHEVLELNDQYTTEELVAVTKKLIKETNQYHAILAKIDSVPVVIPYTKEEIFSESSNIYAQLSESYSQLSYSPSSIKKSILSIPLTYMGFSGYLNPITNEAQVNSLILDFKSPTTVCHEEAHQLGFAKENEANFIAAIATMQYDNTYYKYSGTAFALKFCLNDLFIRDEEKAICLLETLNKGVVKNYVEVNEFWEGYKNPLEPVFEIFYDRFLKINNQPKGIETYSYVVALLVNYLK